MKITEVEQFVRADAMVHDMQLVTEEKDRDTIWKIRKGLYPTLGALRRTGTSVITEDIAVDMKNLAAAIRSLKKIFKKQQLKILKTGSMKVISGEVVWNQK